MPRLTEELSAPLKMMQDSARRIARVAIEAKLPLDEDEYVEKFRPHLMDVVHAWATVGYVNLIKIGDNSPRSVTFRVIICQCGNYFCEANLILCMELTCFSAKGAFEPQPWAPWQYVM